MVKILILVIGFMIGFYSVAQAQQQPVQQAPQPQPTVTPKPIQQVPTQPKLLFKSNFGPLVKVEKIRDIYPNGLGGWQDIKGKDAETGFTWSGGLPPVESEITNLAIWSGFPCGDFKTCYRPGKL